MLVCPDCNHILTKETVSTDAPGGYVTVDVCPYCGGVWFDHYEINRFPTFHAVRLSGTAREGDSKKLTGFHKCPHCNIKLKKLTEDNISQYAHIFTCPHCRGHWVSKKELIAVKKYQAHRLALAKRLNIPLPTPFAVLIPLLLLAVTAIAIPYTVNQIQQAQQARLRAKEIIGPPTIISIKSGQVLISFTTAQPVTSQLSLTAPQLAKPVLYDINKKPATLHTLHLTDLIPATTYTFTITVTDAAGTKSTSQQYQFTAP